MKSRSLCPTTAGLLLGVCADEKVVAASAHPTATRPTSRTKIIVMLLSMWHANHTLHGVLIVDKSPYHKVENSLLMRESMVVRLGSRGSAVCESFAMCGFAWPLRTLRDRVPHNEPRYAR